ncbi:MBL fold metallo-hydrolase [Thiofilum flexile]|uniref:MBL fold metallo-hydrolase n=1 Tax=Thiofilum flexile TaxID=125627 RepID=UPI00037B3B6B|nr:MBL fold metallo-hydrolase [Thiofilum flexile]
MLRFASLGSGSKGNATLVESGKTRVLIDCGFTLSEVEKRLWRLSCNPEDLSAIVVTHEHGDHANGVGRLSRRFRIPVYSSVGTFNSIRDNDFARFQPINIHQAFTIQDLEFTPFPVPHDAREPCQLVISDGQWRLGLLTDTGTLTPCIKEHLYEVDALLLECNYDARLLETGPYHYQLKQRVASSFGHLANGQATQFLQQINTTKLQHIIGMHLSEQNNLPDYAKAALAEGLNCEAHEVDLACQAKGFDWRVLE